MFLGCHPLQAQLASITAQLLGQAERADWAEAQADITAGQLADERAQSFKLAQKKRLLKDRLKHQVSHTCLC